MTPFAIGSAVSAALAGRLVQRLGRKLTVAGLCLVAAGLVTVAILAWLVPTADLGLALLAPLLVAGMVISPNTTLILGCVPTRMAGVAGGALQTGQRIGTAIGTAVLAGVRRATVTARHGDYPGALGVAMLCSVAFILVALALGIFELWARRTRRSADQLPSVTLAAPSE